jgi:hypothetical protein
LSSLGIGLGAGYKCVFSSLKYLTSRSLLRLRSVRLSAIAYFSQLLLKKLGLPACTVGLFLINIPVLRGFVSEFLTLFLRLILQAPAARSGL